MNYDKSCKIGVVEWRNVTLENVLCEIITVADYLSLVHIDIFWLYIISIFFQ